MSAKPLNLLYAIRNGVGIGIEDVESGLKCGCACPACGEPLVAKKGKKVIHHFAHSCGHTCEYGYETALHLMAKDILSKVDAIVIPAVYVQFPHAAKEKLLYCEACEISISRVDLERQYQSLVPDVVVYSGARKFFLELFVTHPVDEEKLEKLRKAKISCLEIDLSKIERAISYEALRQILIGNSRQKKC